MTHDGCGLAAIHPRTISAPPDAPSRSRNDRQEAMAEEPIEQDYALIIQQPGKAEQTLAKFVKLLLSYQYGLNTEIVSDFTKVRSVLRQGADRMRCSFVIQSKAVSARSTVPVLTDKGRIPVFLVLPGYVANDPVATNFFSMANFSLPEVALRR